MNATTLAEQLHDLFERHHAFRMQSAPEFATFEGDHRYNDQLSDLSLAAHEAQHSVRLQFLAELLAIPKAELSAEDQLNYDMFALLLNEEIDGHAFNEHLMPINQMTGYQLFLPQLIEIQPLQTEDHYSDYFARLKAFPKQVNDVIENMRQGMATGWVQPRFVIEQTLPQMQSLMPENTQDSVFFIPLNRQGSLDAAARERLGAELKAILETAVIPAYKQLHDFTRDEYLPACRDTAGVWDLPDGEAYYEYLICKYTAPGMSAHEIHEIGLKEVERIHHEKAKIKDQLDFDGTVEEFNHYLRTSPDFYFKTKEELWNTYQSVMDEAYEKVPALFNRMPKAPCELKEVEAYKAPSAPQAYYMPAPEDGSRPGYYYLNTYDLPSRPSYAVTALTLHEAIPGHHLQLALAQELSHLPYFRRRLHVTAYLEGWGLYSEHLGYELEMYQDRYQHYGALSFEVWRACRLVVDTGLHAKKWSREEAVAFMKKHVANTEMDIRSEVDRYLILPGQALAYKIGELKIKALRSKAEATLKDKFNIKDFHQVVIENGAVPLAVLEHKVNEWLAMAQST
jgi:uncharacterized protein (DUF885 family)